MISMLRTPRGTVAKVAAVASVLTVVLAAGCASIAGLTDGPTTPTRSASSQPLPNRGHGAKQNPGPPHALGGPSVPPALTAVTFISQTTGWVAGDAGSVDSATLLHTTNAGRTWSSTPLTTSHVVALGFADGQHGWALVTTQDVPSILGTTDGGGTWSTEWTGPTQINDLQSFMAARILVFNTKQVVVVVGDMVLQTTDGGVDWTTLPFPGGFSPISASFVTPEQGWVVGSTGSCGKMCALEVLSTASAGTNWHNQYSFTVAAGSINAGIDFSGAQDGWVFAKSLGSQRTLYHTTNGGQLWTVEYSNFSTGRDAVGPPVFVTPQVGWIAEDGEAAPLPGAVFMTTDGGKTWTGANQGNWSILQVNLVSATDGWALSDRPQGRNFLVHSTNGGQSWTQVLPAPYPSADLSFVSPEIGFGVGLPSDPSAVLGTTDGGWTWSQVSELPNRLQAVSVSFADEDAGLVLANTTPSGGARTLLTSSNGGRTWVPEQTPAITGVSTLPFLKLFKNGAGLLQSGGYPNNVLDSKQSQDAPWAKQTSLPGGWTEFSFLDTEHGFMAQNGHSTATLSVTTNGGTTWIPLLTLPADTTVQALDFVNADDGWMITQVNYQGEQLWQTTDGGEQWAHFQVTAAEHTIPLGESLRLDFANAQDGWLLSGSALLATTDGGTSWHLLS